MHNAPKVKTTRVQLDFPTKRVEELEKLLEKCGLATRKDLFENALALFEWAASEAEKGRQIGTRKEDASEFNVVIMPALQNIAKH